MKKVRTRFAPSPTGALHIGGVRTALYNLLFAKQNDGEFILRIEDTDQKRYEDYAEKFIEDSFKWFGIEFDESPSKPNPKYGNYRQSEREYVEYVDYLISNGHAYHAFDTAEELDEMRAAYQKMGKSFMYNYVTRVNMKNSYTLPADEVRARIDRGDDYVIRFNIPRDRTIVLDDLIRGKIKVNTSTLDDKVLMKSDFTPTYHMANIVDDHLMEISHVIRGEEWLPSMPLHILLYEAMGWEAPQFAHLNLILNPDGKGKLSKRSAIKKGFSVFPLTAGVTIDDVDYIMEGYKEKGYEPAAVLNFLALLGWSPKGNREIVSITEMIEEFDFSRLSKAGARFQLDKLDWFNSQYVNMLSCDELGLPTSPYDDERREMIAELCKERAVFRKDIDSVRNIFYNDVKSYADSEKITGDCIEILYDFSDKIDQVDFFDKGEIKQFIYNLTVEKSIKFGSVMPGLREVLTGGVSGPDLFSTMYILGKAETQKRISVALNYINHG